MQRFHVALLLVLAAAPQAVAQSRAYVPLSKWKDELSIWEACRTTMTSLGDAKSTARPALPEIRPISVELLQDAILRKHPVLLDEDVAKARRLIERRYRSGTNGRNQLNGAMAEAIFLNINPGWGYVAKPNASQHDVYRPAFARRPPINGQVKFHRSGSPNVYARDMIKDFRAHRFFVPDDHVLALRRYWLNQYNESMLRGDLSLSKFAARNAGRVQGIGATSFEILRNTREAFEVCAAESRAVYVGLAASIASSLGEIGWDYTNGLLSRDQAMYRSAKYASLIGTGIGTDALLSQGKQGALRGTWKGNAIVAASMLAVDTSWNVHEHGGYARALRHPDFYEQLGGSASGLGLSIAASAYAAASTSEFGPWVAVPSSLAAGTAVGVGAYCGGRSATAWFVRSLYPEMYQQLEQQQIGAAKELLANELRFTQMLK